MSKPVKARTPVKIGKILFILCVVFIVTLVFASFGIAFAGGVRGTGLLGACFFLAGGVIVVLAQLIPAGILLSSLMGGMISPSKKSEAPVEAI